ncbi:cell division protein FtsL [Streptococcus oricebi]|uniref:Cell division protein FtsL n=1 Tax=Streptococcus oricebi TaxID=1547447 RepID=A0ABS5B3S2_9STRE|nr:cell division protein FtsL [Streptococcus oricebi]MBP2623477.1 cell division protein FtsL [Streptococcus oricebi]
MPARDSDKNRPDLPVRIRRFSRIEKAFYGSIVLTAVIIAVSIIFMQTRMLQVQRDLAELNTKVEGKQTELNDAKQEVNELTRKERLSSLASSQEMTIQNGNVKTAE